MFEKYFLELKADKYPYIISGLSRGRAINLTQGMNACQIYWAQQRGVPEDGLRYSAKAKQQHNGESGWIIEISESPKHTHKAKGGMWLSELLAQAKDTIAPAEPYQFYSNHKQESLLAPEEPINFRESTQSETEIPESRLRGLPTQIPAGYVVWGSSLRKATDLVKLINAQSELARGITAEDVMEALEREDRLVIPTHKER
jgi:hypothetical protein